MTQLKQANQNTLTYRCLISGIEVKVLAPEGMEESLILNCLHPVLSLNIKELDNLTDKLLKASALNHLHLCAWIVQLNQLELIQDIEFLAERLPNLGEAFSTFFIPWLKEIYYNQVLNLANTGKPYALPKFSFSVFNTDEPYHSANKVEQVKRQLIAWATQVKINLNSSLNRDKPKGITESKDTRISYIPIDDKIKAKGQGISKSLRHLAGYLKTCLSNRVMGTELTKAIETLYNIESVPSIQVRHLRQLVLDYGLENFADHKLAYDTLLSLISKTLADKEGIEALLGLNLESKRTKEVKPKFELLPESNPESNPELKSESKPLNPMLAALALQKARQTKI